jgi:hypothetical protein
MVGGDSSSGQTNVPPDLTNAVAVSAANYYCLALKANGTIAASAEGKRPELRKSAETSIYL